MALIAICILSFILFVSLGTCLFLGLAIGDLKHAMKVREAREKRPTPMAPLAYDAHDTLVRTVRDQFCIGTVNGAWSVSNGPEVFDTLKCMETKFSPEQNLIVGQLLAQIRVSLLQQELLKPKPVSAICCQPSLN